MEQPESAALQIKSFTASACHIIEGETVLFSWDVEHADKVLLNDKEVAHIGEASLTITQDEKIKLGAKHKGWFGKSLAEYIDITLAQPELTLHISGPVLYLQEGAVSTITCVFTNVGRFELILTKRNGVDVSQEVLTSGSNLLKEKIWKQNIPLDLQTEADVIIRAYNGNRSATSDTIPLRIKKPSITGFSAEKILVMSGAEVHISWETEGARKIEIDNGVGDVTGLHSCRFRITAKQTFRLTIKVTGNFKEVTEQSVTIYVARFIHFFASNNNDHHDPVFYLNWDSEYFDTVTLYPQNIPVPSRCNLFMIPCSNSSDAYRLTGTLDGHSCELELPVYPAEIHSFRLEEQRAILNTEAHLRWDIENYQSIALYPPVNSNPGPHGTAFYVTEQIKKVILIVWGRTNIALQEIEIEHVKAPHIVSIIVPQPSIRYELILPAIPVSLIPTLHRISNRETRIFNSAGVSRKFPNKCLYHITFLSKIILAAVERPGIYKAIKRRQKTSVFNIFPNIKNIGNHSY